MKTKDFHEEISPYLFNFVYIYCQAAAKYIFSSLEKNCSKNLFNSLLRVAFKSW